MKPTNLKTKIFLDSGDPKETRAILDALGFLDGQTTNPSLIAKNPEAADKKFNREEIDTFYASVVREVSSMIPNGSVSIEVYADADTSAEVMLEQARIYNTWIPNAHIKFPTTTEGLKAAEQAVKEGIRVNMTLVFSQAQAAAVYAATRGANRGDVFLSPFIGRLDDIGENGMDLIANIIQLYKQGDKHVEVLAASVRSMDHFLYSIKLGADIITTPFKILKEWADAGMPVPEETFYYNPKDLKAIAFQDIDLSKDWQEFDIHHELTDKGIKKFAEDWNRLIEQKE